MLSVYGSVQILKQEELFETLLQRLKSCLESQEQPLIGLSGGSTPKAFYQWVIQQGKLRPELAQKGYWGVSDERRVPLESQESNLGNAQRLFLDPLAIPSTQHLPFEAQLEPALATARFIKTWHERFPTKQGFDLCLLGMGEDAHIASLFPHSPLLQENTQKSQTAFASIDVPAKGWRFSLTPDGLGACREIIIMACGASKAKALKSVFTEPYLPEYRPAQILKACAPSTTWLLDAAAASELQL